jgi:hypothetical protein
MIFRAETLYDIDFLIAGALPERDRNAQILRCSERSLAFGIIDPVEKIVDPVEKIVEALR